MYKNTAEQEKSFVFQRYYFSSSDINRIISFGVQ